LGILTCAPWRLTCQKACEQTLAPYVHYDPPKTIIKRLRTLEKSIATDLDELEAMLEKGKDV
jgi:hypothetical protein